MASKSKKSPAHRHKQRGLGLSTWLILIILHGILAVFLVMDLRKQVDEVMFPWLVAGLLLASVARVVGAAGIWLWGKWGLYLYAGGVLVAIVAGLLLTGNMLIIFGDILPLAILGWLLRNKWTYFE